MPWHPQRGTVVHGAAAFRERLIVAQTVETMRKKLEALQVGSQLNALIATDSRLEVERSLATAIKTGESAKAELAAMIAERDAYDQNWRVQVAEALSEGSRKLSDARESLNKALLRRQLIELHADRDATVLTVAKVSEGSVLQAGEQLITLVPADAPLEIEANIAGHDSGFVHVGAPVAVKFETFPVDTVWLGVRNGPHDQRRQLHRARQCENPLRLGSREPRQQRALLPFAHHPRPVDAARCAGWLSHLAGHAGCRRHQGRQAHCHGLPPRPNSTSDVGGDARTVKRSDQGTTSEQGRRCEAVEFARSRHQPVVGIGSTAARNQAAQAVSDGAGLYALCPCRQRRHRRGRIPGRALLSGRFGRPGQPHGERALARARRGSGPC